MFLPPAAGEQARTEAAQRRTLEALDTPDTPQSAPVRRVRQSVADEEKISSASG